MQRHFSFTTFTFILNLCDAVCHTHGEYLFIVQLWPSLLRYNSGCYSLIRFIRYCFNQNMFLCSILLKVRYNFINVLSKLWEIDVIHQNQIILLKYKSVFTQSLSLAAYLWFGRFSHVSLWQNSWSMFIIVCVIHTLKLLNVRFVGLKHLCL